MYATKRNHPKFCKAPNFRWVRLISSVLNFRYEPYKLLLLSPVQNFKVLALLRMKNFSSVLLVPDRIKEKVQKPISQWKSQFCICELFWIASELLIHHYDYTVYENGFFPLPVESFTKFLFQEIACNCRQCKCMLLCHGLGGFLH